MCTILLQTFDTSHGSRPRCNMHIHCFQTENNSFDEKNSTKEYKTVARETPATIRPMYHETAITRATRHFFYSGQIYISNRGFEKTPNKSQILNALSRNTNHHCQFTSFPERGRLYICCEPAYSFPDHIRLNFAKRKFNYHKEPCQISFT